MTTSSNSEMSAKVTLAAYAKVLLHGARHSSETVLGLLLGSRSPENNQIIVEDVCPVLHGPPVGPLFDLALTVVPSLFDKKEIVGIYFSNDRCDTDLAPVYIPKIVKSLVEKGHLEACTVFQLKNSLIERKDALCINATQDGQCVVIDVCDAGSSIGPSKVSSKLQESSLLSQKNIRMFADFEDHSNNVEGKINFGDDFRNPYVAKALSS